MTVKEGESGCLGHDVRFDCQGGDTRGRDIIFTFTGFTPEEPEKRRIRVLRQFQFVATVSLAGHGELMRRGPEL